ncbi:MAG: ImmA/IrrE family metallo-endopeptidase [Acidobacteria bacterium]|nr:MAG: ImmA/IrrE family metallo-endopeptidase [Acidobacteriota bacterium]
MKWVKDQTGRFSVRPHYLPEELDSECEKLITDFLLQRHRKVEYPVRTDDVTVLIETLTDDLDLYADLSQEDGDVEGVTDFFPGHRPKVKISRELALDPRMSNRLRTTLTHELGHVKFHAFMYESETSGNLFSSAGAVISNKCKRDNMLGSLKADWMEWQAGFSCGAFLMPVTALRATVRQFLEEHEISVGQFEARTSEAGRLISTVSNAYAVSREAARVRLLQQGTLSETALPAALF